MVMYVGHFISLIIYVAVLCTVFMAFLKVKDAHLYGPIKQIIPAFLTTLSFQASLFLVLQIDWIAEGFNEAVGDITAHAWLAFDYFNGFALLSFATALNIWLGWRNPNGEPENHGRRSTDL